MTDVARREWQRFVWEKAPCGFPRHNVVKFYCDAEEMSHCAVKSYMSVKFSCLYGETY